ncbi:MAG: MerR family transcriptional regulator [Alphaproteobacteria bacterium]|nr:MerR family transcriptional regulator [Alphaproteobacteria bacterium]
MDNEYFVSINDVVKKLSVPAHTLRYWEKQFSTAIRPVTGNGGRRYYRQDTIDRLVVIRDLLYKNGLTIAGVKKLIHDGKLPRAAAEFAPTAGAQIIARPMPAETAPSINDDIDTALDFLKSAKQLLNNQ